MGSINEGEIWVRTEGDATYKFVQSGISSMERSEEYMAKSPEWNFQQLGNGNSIRFWEDRWLPGQIKLAEVVINNLPEEYLEVKVADVITEDGEWNLDHFVPYLTPDIVCTILYQRLHVDVEDSPSWRYTASGDFSTRSAYMSQVENNSRRDE